MPGTLTCAVVSEIKGLLKFSQEELSTISGIPRSTLTKILAGTSIIDLEQLAKIASALNTSVGAIIQKAESRLARAEETSTTSPAPTLPAAPEAEVVRIPAPGDPDFEPIPPSEEDVWRLAANFTREDVERSRLEEIGEESQLPPEE